MTNKLLIEFQYLPPIHYFAKMLQYDEVWLEGQESFVKSSYRNRCYIAGANGKLRLSVPLEEGRGVRQPFKDVRPHRGKNWPHQHWQSLLSAYGHAPFWEHYAPYFEKLYRKPPKLLFELDMKLLKLLLKLLKMEVKLKYTQVYHHEAPPQFDDWRNAIHPSAEKCRNDPTFTAPRYMQVFEEKHGFIPDLSIVDLLFNEGPNALPMLKQSIQQ